MLYKMRRDGNLWIGTQTEGVIRLNPQTGERTNYSYSNKGKNSIGDTYVRSILVDEDGLVWVGTLNSGIALIDEQRQPIRLAAGLAFCARR